MQLLEARAGRTTRWADQRAQLAGSAWKYARCCRPFLAFRPFLDAEQHAAGHDEDHGPHQFLGSARGDARDAGTRTDLLRDSSRDRPGPSATISRSARHPDSCPPLGRRPVRPSVASRSSIEAACAVDPMSGWHRHRHCAVPLTLDRTRKEWGLLTGQERGPRPGHQWGPFHGHGQLESLGFMWSFPISSRLDEDTVLRHRSPRRATHLRPRLRRLVGTRRRPRRSQRDTPIDRPLRRSPARRTPHRRDRLSRTRPG
jgi:hypothetical protein